MYIMFCAYNTHTTRIQHVYSVYAARIYTVYALYRLCTCIQRVIYSIYALYARCMRIHVYRSPSFYAHTMITNAKTRRENGPEGRLERLLARFTPYVCRKGSDMLRLETATSRLEKTLGVSNSCDQTHEDTDDSDGQSATLQEVLAPLIHEYLSLSHELGGQVAQQASLRIYRSAGILHGIYRVYTVYIRSICVMYALCMRTVCAVQCTAVYMHSVYGIVSVYGVYAVYMRVVCALYAYYMRIICAVYTLYVLCMRVCSVCKVALHSMYAIHLIYAIYIVLYMYSVCCICSVYV